MAYPRPSPESIELNKRNNHVVTIGQLYHLATLVAQGKHPDGTYGNDEYNAWEVLKNMRDYPGRFV